MFLPNAFCHADGTRWADEAAEVTANALCADDAWLTGFWVEGDGLVTAVCAGGETTTTTDATFTVNLRIDDGVAVEVAWRNKVRYFFANERRERGQASL